MPLTRKQAYNRVRQDYTVYNHGSIVVLQPLTKSCDKWIRENVENPQWWNGGLVVEPRYLTDLIEVLSREGFRAK